MPKEIVTETQKLAAEFLGTFLLVFSVGLTKAVGADDVPLEVFGPTAIGCVLMTMVYALAPISGAHLNPAVTFSVYLQNGIESAEAFKYVLAQAAAGAAAGLATGFMYGFGAQQLTVTPEFEFLGAPLVEFLYTFMLCFVVLNVAVAKAQTPNSYYGVAIGFVVIAGGIGGGKVSGACLNPAVALGLNFMSPTWRSLFLPVYIVVELLGGFFATTFLHIVRPETKASENAEVGEKLGALTKVAYRIEGMLDAEDTAEFLGTFFLCLTISLTALADSPQKNGGVWSIAACLMCLIFAMGDISGGLFNPALTLAFTGRFYKTKQGLEGDKYSQKLADITMVDEHNRSARKEPIKYAFAQLLGGAAGSGTTMLIYLFKMSTVWPAAEIKTGNTTAWDGHPSKQYTLGQAFFAEAFGTFILCFVVLAVASRKDKLQDYTAFCIGGCIVGAGYSFGPLSGAVLNPAVTLANSLCFKLSLIYKAEPFCYMLAEFCGGALAAIVFRFLIYTHEFPQSDPLAERMVDGVKENE